MWTRKVSLTKPLVEEEVNGKVYRRRNIRNEYSTSENTAFWSYEEEVEDTETRALEIRRKIAELNEELKELGVYHNEDRS